MCAAKTVGIISAVDSDDWSGILTALAESCGLKFRRAQPGEESEFAGLIILGETSAQPRVQPEWNRPSICVTLAGPATPDAQVRFGNGPLTPIPFRGRSLVTSSTVPAGRGEVAGEVIATANGSPIWVSAIEAGLRQDHCWVTRPWINKDECVFDELNGARFMNLLPLLEWLRSISDWREWQQPPLRACFMFDDPNLHATRYGFAGFAQLAAEGWRHQYHTSFATVPLDAYYVSNAAAQIFRENRQTLSFLIHGNNHTYRELADRDATPALQLALMHQAICRTSRLEQKAGVAVSRVMAPPHGVCSAEMMAAMMGAGFEAVCVSHGSVWTGNPGAGWTVSLGAAPAVVVAGLPVIPRFGLDRKPENQVLLAAYLNQPIVPVGHHWDLADGTDILSSAARVINGLGQVSWGDMTAIARSNYRFKVRGNVVRVRTLSRITKVRVPEGVAELELDAPWLDPVAEKVECRSSGATNVLSVQSMPSPNLRFRVAAGSNVDLIVARTTRTVGQPDTLPMPSLRTIARKMLTEVRDRSMPYLPRRFVRQ